MFIYIYKVKKGKYYTNAELMNAIKEAKNYNSMTNAAKSTTSGCAYWDIDKVINLNDFQWEISVGFKKSLWTTFYTMQKGVIHLHGKYVQQFNIHRPDVRSHAYNWRGLNIRKLQRKWGVSQGNIRIGTHLGLGHK